MDGDDVDDEGEEVMINVGVVVGTSDGSYVGLILFGLEDRKRVGTIDGYDDGLLEGMIDAIVVDVVVGDTVTISVGLAVDSLDGKLVDITGNDDVADDDDGIALNDMVGKVLGNTENDVDGFKLGCGEWMVDGLKVGMPDSRSLGFDVGDATR